MLLVSQRDCLSPLQGPLRAAEGMCTPDPSPEGRGRCSQPGPSRGVLISQIGKWNVPKNLTLVSFNLALCSSAAVVTEELSTRQNFLHLLFPQFLMLSLFSVKIKPPREQMEQIKYSGQWFQGPVAWCVSQQDVYTRQLLSNDWGKKHAVRTKVYTWAESLNIRQKHK